MNAIETKQSIRSAIWVSNVIPKDGQTIFDLGAPREGVCIPYYIPAPSEKLDDFKELIARHFIRHIDTTDNEDDPVAGTVRGRINEFELHALIGINSKYLYAFTSTDTERDLAYANGLNPIRVLPESCSYRLLLWGTKLFVDGQNISPTGIIAPEILRECTLTITALLKHDIVFE